MASLLILPAGDTIDRAELGHPKRGVRRLIIGINTLQLDPWKLQNPMKIPQATHSKIHGPAGGGGMELFASKVKTRDRTLV